MRNKERELEDSEERHQVEIKVWTVVTDLIWAQILKEAWAIYKWMFFDKVCVLESVVHLELQRLLALHYRLSCILLSSGVQAEGEALVV